MSDFPQLPGAQPQNNQPYQPAPGNQPAGYPQQGQNAYPQSGQQSGQYPYQQANYRGGYPSAGYQPAPPSGAGNALGIVALVLGIIALALSWIPFVGLISVLLGLAALICGGIALARKGAAKVMPAIGASLGLVAMVVAIVVTIVTTIAIGNAVQQSVDLPSGFPTSLPTELNKEHSFKLVVSSDVAAEISYSAANESESKIPVNGSWEKAIAGKSVLGLATISVSAKEYTGNGKLSCEIFVDGQSVDKKSGVDYVSCFGSLK
ncbi:DUF308 domain-containing protein [Psychromicrobium lacuslunae]|uniref:DUF308 domain-containing protein n=1 Tax=Psychromicrobium lacuslunae TaxID=1618207 RepID=UPI00069715DE|nr:DUF308 domain-containing protein [Psychromicrobium lacuslunae]